MSEKGFDQSNVEAKWVYHTKGLSTWIGTWALATYDRLSQGFPQTKQDWVLFGLLQIAFITGVTNSVLSANKIVQ